MNFLKAQAKGLLVGIGTAIVWAAADWFSLKIGLPVSATKSYSEVAFAATSGAAFVFWAFHT